VAGGHRPVTRSRLGKSACARPEVAQKIRSQKPFSIRNCRPPRHIQAMPKFIELPPAVARRFVEDMRAFHAEPNAIKRDEIAARQLHGLKQHYAGKLRLSDVKEMFELMWDHT
jgi:hypothetical protein